MTFDPTPESYHRIRVISERLGQQHSHLLDRQLLSHAQTLLRRTKDVKSDKGVYNRLANSANGRGQNLLALTANLSRGYDLSRGVVKSKYIEAITELREFVPEPPPPSRRNNYRRARVGWSRWA